MSMTMMRRSVPAALSAAARCGVRRGRLAAGPLHRPAMLISADPSSFADRTRRSISADVVPPSGGSPAATGTRVGTCCNRNHPSTPRAGDSRVSSAAWRAPAILVNVGNQRASCGVPLLCRGSTRLFSSGTPASLLGDDGFDPFKTHHNAKDANRADRMVRDLVKRRLASGDGIEIREGFLRGALNSYRTLSERAAVRARIEKRRPDATLAKKADELLAFVEQAYANDSALTPDSKSYSMVVDAYAKIGDPERAEAVLLRLEKLWRSGNEKVKPDNFLYNSVVDAWAKSGRREAPKRAEAILEHMEQLNQQDHKDVRPTTVSYSAVINAWAKSREKGAAQRAEAILHHMEQLNQQGHDDVRPTTITYSTVINAWAKSREKGAPRRAEALLEKMEEMYRQGNADVRPTAISYSTVINAWAKSREKGAARRAEAILNHMFKLHEGGREEWVERNVDQILYASILSLMLGPRAKIRMLIAMP